MFSSVYAESQVISSFEYHLGFEDLSFLTENENIDHNSIKNWSTTATDGQIEVWVDGTNNETASEGNYFVELNANEQSALYFDIKNRAYDVMHLTFDHRARDLGGYDIIEVFVGGANEVLESAGIFSSDNNGWKNYKLEVPIKTTDELLRVRFEAIETVSGDPTIGNFLDNIQFKLKESDVDRDNMDIRIYPVPFGDFVKVDLPANNQLYSVSVIDLQGKTILVHYSKQNLSLDMSGFNAGFYVLLVKDKHNNTILKKKVSKF